jgi:hypothetical protein
MIVKKLWIKSFARNKDLGYWMTKEVHYEGFFLFGIIPLYIRENKVNYH